MRLHFMGGTDTVTGSQHILEANGRKVLRDCGMFQGRRKEANQLNRDFRYNPLDIDALVLSHAHIDHCGNIPSLTRNGYENPIYATIPTVSITKIMLLDAAHIQEQDAAYLNQKTNRRGFKAVEPLYVTRDAEAAIKLFQGYPYHAPIEVVPGMTATFHEAGHILGAALTSFDIKENGRNFRVGYAVDLGRKDLPMIRDPDLMTDLDALIIESTYGDRKHGDVAKAEEQLFDIVSSTLARGGKVLIPSFALERTQEILYHLSSLISSGRLPEIPVYLDSPMATAVTKVFEEEWKYMDDEFMVLRSAIGRIMRPPWVHCTASVEESKQVVANKKPCIVISASGMCEHGRILHHLKHGIENPANAIVIVGFQAQHTLGRRIVERQKEVRIFGDTFALNAEVRVLNAFSAHADCDDLVDYVRETRPKKVFLVHGEQSQRDGLAEKLKTFHHDVHKPRRGDVVTL
ncbi:MAG: MBL fold metallo-hydrolase [Spartobacteria bacterium]|nr:MBL fold metallo-hydrolase [Spartobacteria bacterium]